MAYETMNAQAGDRLIIRYCYFCAGQNTVGHNGSIVTSHFASVDELMEHTKAINRIVVWYQINGGEKVAA